MFEQSLLETRIRRPWTVGLALLGEALLVGILAIIPLIYVQTLPPAALPEALIMPRPPSPPPSPARPAQPRQVSKNVAPRKFSPTVLTAPAQIPKQVAPIAEAPALPDVAVTGGVPGGIPGGQPGGLLGGIPNSLPVPPPPPPPIAEPAKPPPTPVRLRVGGNVEAARLLHEVKPAYPRLAREARVAGMVKMNAIIAKDGTVEDLKVVSGHPLLVQAAMDAVKQWVYKPTYLNGLPAEIETEIDVTFTLA